MKNKMTLFDRIMMAVTFAEAGEADEAVRVLAKTPGNEAQDALHPVVGNTMTARR
jgi:hypothetical protein